MKAGLNRSGKQPKPPKVCITFPLPIVGNTIWVIIIGDTIIGPFPGPHPWNYRFDATPMHPSRPAGWPLALQITTDAGTFNHFALNQVQNLHTVDLDTPGSIAQFRITPIGIDTQQTYEWYARTPRQPPP